MKLYVGNLGDDGAVKSDDLRPLFESYGTVTECEIIKNYAFVHMSNESEANEAVQNLNGTNVNGRSLKVEKSESKGPKKPSCKLFVGNLAEGTTYQDLADLFNQHTSVIEADVIKNFGFVHIDAEVSKGKVSDIIRSLNGHDLKGNKIRVQQSTSGVRQKPGMGGDTCYRCGQDGHWSKECPKFPDHPNDNRGGRDNRYGNGRGSDRGSSGNRSMRMGGGSSGQYRGEPYPQPPPPSYMRERMNDYGGDFNPGPPRGSNAGGENYGGPRDNYGGPRDNYGPPRDNYGPPPRDNYGPPPRDNYGPPRDNYGVPRDNFGNHYNDDGYGRGNGGGSYGSGSGNSYGMDRNFGNSPGGGYGSYDRNIGGDGGYNQPRGGDPYNQMRDPPMYDRRDNYPGPSSQGGPGPMRGHDPYGRGNDSYYSGGNGGAGNPSTGYGAGPGYNSGGGYGPVISTNTGAGGGDMYSRRSPVGGNGFGNTRGGYPPQNSGYGAPRGGNGGNYKYSRRV